MLIASSLRSLVRKRSQLGLIRKLAPCLVFVEALDGFDSDRGGACALFAMLPMRMTLLGHLWPYSLIAVALVYFLPCYLCA